MATNPWEKISVPEEDVLCRRIDSKHPFDLFWARDSYGHFLFVYEFITEEIVENTTKLNGITVRILSPEQLGNESYMLVLILEDKKDWQIFLALCNDLTSVTRKFKKNDTGVKTIFRRLMQWQKFLTRKRSELLSESQIKGLLGELYFLSNYIIPNFGVAHAVQSWQGPEGMPQDFNVSSCAIESKCQLGTTTPRVHITSVDQLCTQLPEMFIYVITLGLADKDTPGKINLPEIIELIRERLDDQQVAYEDFNNILYQTGYADLEAYGEFNYVVTNEQMFRVEDEFPKICADMISPGIERLSYDINLADCERFSKTPEWIKLP